MNQTILINEKNNKYYIESDFSHFIENVIFFDNKKQCKILELNRQRKIKAQLKNDLYNTTYTGEAEARKIILNNEPTRKIKENLKTSSNFYTSKTDNYGRHEIQLYININAEKIEITETEETREELSAGYFHIYRNFTLKNLLFTCGAYKHIFLKNSDVEKLSYKDFEIFDLKKISDEINNREAKALKLPTFTKYLNKLKELKRAGFDYIGHKYEEEEAQAEAVEVFKETYTTEAKKTRDANIKYLKDIIYDEKKLINLFNRFNINIDSVKFDDTNK